jgi:peptidoglycan hydrolase CwlO-like protein
MNFAADDVVDPAPTVNLEAPLDDLRGELNFIANEIDDIEQLIVDLRERVYEYNAVRDKLEEKIDELELEEELETA